MLLAQSEVKKFPNKMNMFLATYVQAHVETNNFDCRLLR